MSQLTALTPVPLSGHELAGEVKRRALGLGFDLVGIAPASPSMYRDYFRQWLDDGRGGTMDYLAARFEERVDPAAYLPDARSVVCVAVNYHVPLEPVPERDRPHHGRVARYALGDDYHDWLKSRLYALADWIRDAVPGSRTRCGVDTAPVMERELAARAGIGWVGKNTCVIHPKVGSWILLGEVLTTLDLPADDPVVDRCGTCTRCIDACPTAAITGPYELDASRCVSYLTIEHAGDVAPALSALTGDWLFGCDVCQDVCPWNRAAPDAAQEAFADARFPTGSIDVRDVGRWSADEWRVEMRGSAMKRVKLPQLQRNAATVARHAAQTDAG